MKNLFVFAFVGIFAITIISSFLNSGNIAIVENCKVIKLSQQQLIGESSTEYRYLVVTDKETFVCESSILNGKFNNSDIFLRLKEGEIYNFEVVGLGKSGFTEYRNIISIK